MSRLARQLRVREEAKHTQTIIHCQSNDSLASHACAFISRLRPIARGESATIEIDKYRQLIFCGFGRGPNVEVKTVFAHAIGTENHVAKNWTLHTTWTELIRLACSFPIFDWLRRLPSEVADRWRRKGNAFECSNSCAGVGGSFNYTVRSLDSNLSEPFTRQHR